MLNANISSYINAVGMKHNVLTFTAFNHNVLCMYQTVNVFGVSRDPSMTRDILLGILISALVTNFSLFLPKAVMVIIQTLTSMRVGDGINICAH